jgi:hypothetical protein
MRTIFTGFQIMEQNYPEALKRVQVINGEQRKRSCFDGVVNEFQLIFELFLLSSLDIYDGFQFHQTDPLSSHNSQDSSIRNEPKAMAP